MVSHENPRSAICAMTGPIRCLLLLACLANPALAAPPEGSPGDNLLVVDCLLPGQIRHLGNKTYVSARRPVKTTAADCRIRGGEYVAFDRANLASALTVWLPLAQEGDPEAMTTVGEMFERGTGSAPDYSSAAEWYRRAAEQNHSRAQINLGQLYERGLGVRRDPQQAISWYRQAAGIEGEIALDPRRVEAPVASAAASVARDNALLREQNVSLRQESEALRDEMARTRNELAQSLQALDSLKAELDDSARPGPASPEKMELLSRLQSDVAEGERRVGELQARLAQSEGDAAQLQAALDQSRDALAMAEQMLREREEQSASRLAELQALRERVGAREEAGAVEQEQFSLLQMRLEQSEAEVASQREALATATAAVEKLEAKLAEKERELSERQAVEEARRERALAGPEITLIEPELPATRDATPTVAVRGGADSRQVIGLLEAAAGLLSLTINDSPAEVNAQGIFRVDIPLDADRVPVSIVAVDNQGKRVSSEFVLARTAAEPPGRDAGTAQAAAPEIPPLAFGNYHALVIGIDDYRHLPKLRTAVNDANAVADLLAQRYGFEVVKLLNPTRYDILSALNTMRENLTSADNLLIYYAGHGELDRVNMRGHWLPLDAEADNPANWISNVAVTDILNIINARGLLVVADSCYSGSLTRSALTQLDGKLTGDEQLTWLKTMLRKRSRTVLTSGGLKPTLDEGGGEHSVFADALLDVLASNEGLLSGLNLYRAVSARVAYAASNLRFDQVPEYAPIKYTGHEGGDFFLVPGTADR